MSRSDEVDRQNQTMGLVKKPVGKRQMQRRVKAAVEAFFNNGDAPSPTPVTSPNDSPPVSSTTHDQQLVFVNHYQFDNQQAATSSAVETISPSHSVGDVLIHDFQPSSVNIQQQCAIDDNGIYSEPIDDDDVDSYCSQNDSNVDDEEYINSSPDSSSESDTESDDLTPDQKTKLSLATWAVECNIPRCHVNSLLKLLRSDAGLHYLPSDWRTLAKIELKRGKLLFRQVNPGMYAHVGLVNGILLTLLSIDPKHLPDVIELILNVDGVPVSKSSGSQLWPILVRIHGFPGILPFVVGIYHGFKKPVDINDFLADFIDEFLILDRDGLMIDGKIIRVTIIGLVCDAPARAFMTSVVPHNSYYSCHKCITTGEWITSLSGRGGRVTYPETNAPVRTDASFRQRTQAEHHDEKKTRSNIERVLRDMIRNVPIDYMHLTCLGVMKKLLQAWTKGRFGRTKLSQTLQDLISKFLVFVAKYVPDDFPRKTRPLPDLPHMKATEHRLHMLYVGPVAFKNSLPQDLYDHFMLFHVAVKLLSNEESCKTYAEYAENLLKTFVQNCAMLYGPQFITYNIHNLIHLPADVLMFGCLDNFSSFPFENKLQKMKNLIRRGGKPLQQIVRRMHEVDKYGVTVNFKTTKNSFSVADPHSAGPLAFPFTQQVEQFKKIKYGRWTLTTKRPNNTVFLHGHVVFVIKNIVRNSLGNVYIIGKRYLAHNNLYEYPLPSMCLHEIVVSEPNPMLESFPVTSVIHKAFRIPMSYPANQSYFVSPLYAHE